MSWAFPNRSKVVLCRHPHQSGAAAIDWPVYRHGHIARFRKPGSISRHLTAQPQVSDQYKQPPAGSPLHCSRARLFSLREGGRIRLTLASVCVQAQLRAFIPEMLKYSTGRGKPGWGKESCKPVWWPEDIPWANVRSDVRTEEQKQRVREVAGGSSSPHYGWSFAVLTGLNVSEGVLDTGAPHHCQKLLQAARSRGPLVRVWRPAGNHNHYHAAPPDHRPKYRSPRALADRGTDHQQPRRNSVAYPGTFWLHFSKFCTGAIVWQRQLFVQVGTGHTVAKLADASELPGVTVAQVNYSTVTDGEVKVHFHFKINVHVVLIDLQGIKDLLSRWLLPV